MRRDKMPAVPPDAHRGGAHQLTGVTCPACPGVLTVTPQDNGTLSFLCRIGHIYSTPELVVLKERRVEEALWGAVEALEELAAFLQDVCVDGERATRALAEASALRALIERMEPANLGALMIEEDSEAAP